MPHAVAKQEVSGMRGFGVLPSKNVRTGGNAELATAVVSTRASAPARCFLRGMPQKAHAAST